MPIAKIAQQLVKHKPLVKHWFKQENLKIPFIKRVYDDTDQMRELSTEGRRTEAVQPHKARVLSLAILAINGAITMGGLTSIVFNGWFVALATILGAVAGVFVAILCYVAGAERHDDE